MRTPNVLLIALLALALFAACANEEKTSTTTPSNEPAASSGATPAPAPEPEEEEEVAADPASSEAAEEPVATQEPVKAPAPASEANPAPMLPRRGEVASMAEPAAGASDPATSQRITVPDAYEIMRAGNGVLVDVRNADAYQYQRIPGALSIPLNEVSARAGELPQDKWIITYCTCPAEETSGAAATTLKNMGFERVAALLGGLQAWRGANLPVEFGQ
jgi:rhodanese-related sulfurtransferase